jgi:hypothetical protein
MLPARWLYPPYTCAMGSPIQPSTLLRSNRRRPTLSGPDSQPSRSMQGTQPLVFGSSLRATHAS